jgi:hypothetical protein
MGGLGFFTGGDKSIVGGDKSIVRKCEQRVTDLYSPMSARRGHACIAWNFLMGGVIVDPFEASP